MSRRMSRRAVLRAIGISPVILSVTNVSGRAEAEEKTEEIVQQYSSMISTQDWADVVERGRRAYKNHHGREWTPNEARKYRKLAEGLFAFYVAGIEYTGGQQNKTLVPPDDFLGTAFEYDGTNTGPKLAHNLAGFTGNHGKLDIETEICAWRCGKIAAERQLEADANSRVVTLESYASAWKDVKADVDKFRAQLQGKQGIALLKGGGGC
jgi:hypothetical protein